MEALGSELNSLRAYSWPPSIPWWAHTHRVVLIQAGDKARRRRCLRTSSDVYYWFWQSCDSSQRNQYQRGSWEWEWAELKARLGVSECSVLSHQVPSVGQWGGNPAIRQVRPWGPAAATSIQLSHWSLFPWGGKKKNTTKHKGISEGFLQFPRQIHFSAQLLCSNQDGGLPWATEWRANLGPPASSHSALV